MESKLSDDDFKKIYTSICKIQVNTTNNTLVTISGDDFRNLEFEFKKLEMELKTNFNDSTAQNIEIELPEKTINLTKDEFKNFVDMKILKLI